MQPGFSIPYTLSLASISANAPALPGVYGITNGGEWIYIGQTDDIRQCLLEHLAESGTELKARNPTGFSYQVCAKPERSTRQDQLIMRYDPYCNRRANGLRSRG